MTALIEKLQSLKLDPYVDIMCLGDPIKEVISRAWGTPSEIPHVYTAKHRVNNTNMRTSIWCNTNDLDFFSNKETVYEFAIIVIHVHDKASWNIASEEVTRAPDTSFISANDSAILDKYNIKEKIFILLKDNGRQLTKIKKYCKDNKMQTIVADLTPEGFASLDGLIQKLSTIIYTKRKVQLSADLNSLLLSVKNG